MNYVKKMCILRQIKQGFSGDGKTLSGLVKIEQYGKNLAVEVSIINFAPLVSGEYYCLLSDGKGKTEMLSLRGKSIFNILSDLDISGGFCGIICYVKTEVVPIAYGINGNGSYDWRAILNKALPPVFPKKSEPPEGEIARSAPLFDEENEPTVYEMNAKIPEVEVIPVKEIPVAEVVSYDDEAVAEGNYFEEKDNERIEPTEIEEDARTQSAVKEQDPQVGSDPSENGDGSRVIDGFKRAPDEYYRSVKRELDELFARYPRDETLRGAFPNSEWARLRGSEEEPAYLVGALYREGKAEYLCYALAAEDEKSPPEEIRGVCTFVPTSPLVGAKGFFVIFQSSATGECVKPPRL